MRVDIGGEVRLFFDTYGPGWESGVDSLTKRPTLVLLHGGPGLDHSGYRGDLSGLADVAQVVMYDHRGNGRSDRRTPDEWNLDTWADDVVRFCDALDIERPVVLGNSFGGMVAMHYAARHPRHAAGVVLSSTMAVFDYELMVQRFGDLGGPEAAEAARSFWLSPDPDIERYREVCGPLYTQNDVNILASPVAVRNLELFDQFRTAEAPTMDLLPGLAAIERPVLLLAGRLDPVCPIESMDRIAEHVPAQHRRYEVFDDCGHGVFRDAPDRSMAVLREFIVDVAYAA